MRRVVITGMGAVSPIGVTPEEITASLENMTSGVIASAEYGALNFASRIWAPVTGALPELSKGQERFLGKGDTLRLGYHAMLRAVADSGLTEDDISNPNTGCIVGTGGPSTIDQCNAWDTTRERGTRRLGVQVVSPTMSSGLAAKIATDFHIKGVGLAITSACATSAHCIGEAALKIMLGYQDVMFAGGSEDCHPSKACGFDGMGALSRKRNETPSVASRAFDADRDGFVDGAGGAIVVLEEIGHALRRNARIYAEVVGYGLTSDGHHMTDPSGEGAARCMRMALRGLGNGVLVRPVDYVNAHGTSTPRGDFIEARALAEVFANDPMPWISSTKSLTGHALGGAGALEAIYSLLMMAKGFVAGSAHIDTLDPEIEKLGAVGTKITRETIRMPLTTVMSNAFGFGGTNASLILQRYER